MKLNIENYNLNCEQDMNDLTKINELIHSLKDNIKSKYYEPYQNFLKKLKNIMNMLYNQFEKELDECKKNIAQNELNDNNDDNDDNDTKIFSVCTNITISLIFQCLIQNNFITTDDAILYH